MLGLQKLKQQILLDSWLEEIYTEITYKDAAGIYQATFTLEADEALAEAVYDDLRKKKWMHITNLSYNKQEDNYFLQVDWTPTLYVRTLRKLAGYLGLKLSID